MCKIVFSNWFPLGKYTDACAMWPFIFVRIGRRWNEWVERHERIHLKQQVELLIIGFYILYPIFALLGCNVFEKEAYNGQWQEDYLEKRKFWAWMDYF